ncbi:ATP-dependent helicase/deoxyribonuclease subunit B [Alicyclobacillus acidoterrestris]|nr:ATP-dependent helicase/deoxyribonuclease subunit B [Alicyclobacillus acidoterrestris]
MADVRFWFGPTGSGKSHSVVADMQRLTEQAPIGPTLFWVVPDDVAFAAEQMLMEQISSALRCEVITLTRLAERIRQAAGGSDEQTINASGKQMLFADVYRELREQLGPLKRAQANVGFYQLVLDAFDEMSQYQVNLAAMEGALESAAASLAVGVPRAQMTVGKSLIGKLRDLCLLYIRYRERLREKGFFDPALLLTAATAAVPQVNWLAESTFYFDGFHRLTSDQVALMGEIAATASQSTFTFVLPDAWTNQELDWVKQASALWPQFERLSNWLPHFQNYGREYLPGVLYSALQLAACLEQKGVSWTSQALAITADVRQIRPLSQLEEVFRGGESVTSSGVADGLRVWMAEDDEAEAHAVADEILRLVEEEHVAFRDIAVLVPSLQEEGVRLHDVFKRYDIPHSLDAFPPLAAHALGRFLLAALRAVVEDLSTDAMARLLRTDFHGLKQADVDWFDMYLKAADVAGAKVWFQMEDWIFRQQASTADAMEFATQEDERANRLRRHLMAFFQPFYEAVSAEILTPLAFARALWDLLMAVNAKSIVAESVVLEDVHQNPLQASQHEQAWQLTVQLLNDLANVGGEAQFVREDLFQLVTSALMEERQSTIPSGIDDVLIRPYTHAHAWVKDYVFVVGASDRALPERVQSNGLLQDDERDMFAQLFGIPIGFTTRELTAIHQLTPYLLFTRANKRLTISFARTHGATEQRPSPYVIRLCDACGTPVQPVHALNEGRNLITADDALYVMRSSVALDLVVQIFAQAKDKGDMEELFGRHDLLDIVSWFGETDARSRRLQRAIAGLSHTLPTGQIEAALVKQLYGSPLKLSVHRLENYAACPYQYFVRFGLRVNPDMARAKVAADIGNLLHDTVFQLVDMHRRAEVRFEQLQLADMTQLAERVFAEQLARGQHADFQGGILGARAADLRNYLHAVAEVLWLQAKQGAYEPFELEWSFGFEDSDSSPLTIHLNNGEDVVIRGRVDRLDVYEDGDTTWFRIFDYKSGRSQKLDATRMFYGLQLQLIVYLAVVQQKLGRTGKQVRPAGAFYLPLLSLPAISEVPEPDAAALSALRKAYVPEGYFNADGTAISAMDRNFPDGKSELFGDLFKKDGTFRQHAKVWTDEEWANAVAFVCERIEQIATDLSLGKVPVRPYLQAHNDSACTRCSFRKVCHFEPLDHGSSYHVLLAKRFDDIVSSSAGEGEEK